MLSYLQKVTESSSGLKYFHIMHIPRAENAQADALLRIASSTTLTSLWSILVKQLQRSSIGEPEPQVNTIDHELSWMGPILDYLIWQQLRKDCLEAIKVKAWAARENKNMIARDQGPQRNNNKSDCMMRGTFRYQGDV